MKTMPSSHVPRHTRPPNRYPPIDSVTAPDKSRLLETVSAASAAYEAARDGLHEAVRAALDHGATWTDIGAVLGVSRQAAFQRFGPKRAPPGGAPPPFPRQ